MAFRHIDDVIFQPRDYLVIVMVASGHTVMMIKPVS